MSAPPHFSVVVPVRNGARWLPEALASVARQTREDWELIVVDDGSTDESAALARCLADARVTVLQQENAGPLAARRRGLGCARGEAVVFLDADDRLRPDALARFATAFDRAPRAAVVYGDRVLVDAEGRVFGSERGALLAARPSGDVLERLLRRNFMSTPGQACIRRHALADAAEWHTELRGMSDWYVWCRIASRGGPFAYCGRGPVIEYRLHAQSMSRRFTGSAPATPDIADVEPAIAAVYALPEVQSRFAPAKLAALRRSTEASAYAWRAQELLRAGRFTSSRRFLLEALRRHPAQPVDLLCLLIALLRFHPPGTARWIGRTA
jgi:glycosyltransferase involved in cell wall biosynthesis